jgi:hypothetical protein
VGGGAEPSTGEPGGALTKRRVAAYVDAGRVPQHSEPFWRGGQAVSPYEQNTQQSPGLGWSSSPQASQSWNQRQAFVGIVCGLRAPQCGQVRTQTVSGIVM